MKRIAAAFNPDLVNPVKVNLRDGIYHCFDGQHTLGAIKMVNGGNDVMIDCKAYSGQPKEWEAKMFAEQNGISRKVESIAKFRALLVAGDVDVVEFYEITNGIGVRMDFTKGQAKNKITACSTAYKIFKSSSHSDYIEIIRILKEAYRGEVEGFANQLLQGVAGFHKQYKGQYKRALLIGQLEKVSPIELVRDANLYKNEGAQKYTNQILRVYNKGTRSSRLD